MSYATTMDWTVAPRADLWCYTLVVAPSALLIKLSVMEPLCVCAREGSGAKKIRQYLFVVTLRLAVVVPLLIITSLWQ